MFEFDFLIDYTESASRLFPVLFSRGAYATEGQGKELLSLKRWA
jgi:hypothetical protein